MTAVTNARAYDWATWLMGIMRSFIAGGSGAFGAGVADTWLDYGHASAAGGLSHILKLMGCTFVVSGFGAMFVFLHTHGAPDQMQASLATAATKTAEAGAAIADAQSQSQAPKEKT
jgi:hypothetical protein